MFECISIVRMMDPKIDVHDEQTNVQRMYQKMERGQGRVSLAINLKFIYGSEQFM